jgi:hypothetical protein
MINRSVIGCQVELKIAKGGPGKRVPAGGDDEPVLDLEALLYG